MPNSKATSKTPQVAAFYDGGEIVNDHDAEGEEIWDVILNIGSDDGVEMGQKVLIYALGPEIIDPSTGNSLGSVEVVRGQGRVVYVQSAMCKVKSIETNKIPRFQQSALTALAGDRKFEVIDQPVPFYVIKIGDLAKWI